MASTLSNLRTLSACLGLLVALPAATQVHVERQPAGGVVVTDSNMGGQRVRAFVGSGIQWQKRSGQLEVRDPATRIWSAAPVNFPQVVSSANLLLGYGERVVGMVYDAERKFWRTAPGLFYAGHVSRGLAVGISQSRLRAVYDRRMGQWVAADRAFSLFALSENLLALFGDEGSTAVYDSVNGRWAPIPGRYPKCIIGNRMAVFFGGAGGASGIYDTATGEFYPTSSPVLAVRVQDGLAVVLEEGGRAEVFTSGRRTWAGFGEDAEQVDIRNSEAVVIDRRGFIWVFGLNPIGFSRTDREDLRLPSRSRYASSPFDTVGYYYSPRSAPPAWPSASPQTGAGVGTPCGCPSFSSDLP